MRTKYGKQIVFVVALTFEDFVNHFRRRKDILPAPPGTQGVIYTKTHNYRYVYDLQTMRGHRGAEVEFTKASERRIDFKELIEQAKKVREK